MTATMKTQKNALLDQVKTAVHSLAPNAKSFSISAPVPEAQPAPDSDWDFLILLPSAADNKLETEIQDRLYDVELETNSVLSSIIRSKQEWLSCGVIQSCPCASKLSNTGFHFENRRTLLIALGNFLAFPTPRPS